VNRNHACRAAVRCCVGFLILVSCGWAQESSSPRHTGVPQDWSEHHIVFSLQGLLEHPDLILREPRIRNQVMQRYRSAGSQSAGAANRSSNLGTTFQNHRDWNVSLVRGHIAADMYPAKFSFDPGAAPSCANDYVVFGLNVAGATGGQANLVAFNNLYSGTGGMCGAAPTVLFAYNVTTVKGGKVLLSPVISLDGTKIAFVESVGTSTIFHVLTWTPGQGTIAKAAAPTTMTSLTVSSTATSTTSSPWIDYSTDTAYMGVDGGVMYKVSGVFNGTPALAAPFPVTVSGGHHLSPPVLDNRLNVLMVGSANGNLYQVATTTGALNVLGIGNHSGTTPGILAAPIIDVTNGTTFVVSANDGTSAVLVEVDTSTLGLLADARIGLGSAGGLALSIQQPAFSNDYYNDPSSGVIRLCGTGAADTTPYQYAFGFTGRTMNTVPVFSQQLLTSTTATCSGWTEFYNPNVNGGTDFFFFGLTQDCSGLGTSGCVVARTTDIAPLVTAPVTGGPSGIVIDNYSTAGQASSIYLTAEGVNTAYKFTQSGLQ
jgi:hypothetical protein